MYLLVYLLKLVFFHRLHSGVVYTFCKCWFVCVYE